MAIDEEIIWDDAPAGTPAGEEIQWDDAGKPAAKAAPEADDESLKDYVDVASSFGSGLAKGAVSLPGLPGDIESLGRAGLRAAGYDVSPETYFATGEEYRQALQPSIPALGEKPQTTAGKYAETLGEFTAIPMAGAAAKSARGPVAELKQALTSGVKPALASETAGQLTEGTELEPYARFGAAVLAGPKAGAAKPKIAETLEAAERAGVDLPTFAALEGNLPKYTAQAASNFPIASGIVRKAATTAKEQMGSALEKAQQEAGGLNFAVAGQTAKQSILDWIEGRSKKITGDLYSELDRLVNPEAKAPTPKLTKTVQDIQTRRGAAGLPSDSKALGLVMEGATRPEGLTFAGIKDLRTNLGEMMDSGILPEGFSKRELNNLYAALSDDLEGAARVVGGPKAVEAFKRANRVNKAVAERREALLKIVGAKGDAAPEAVLGRIIGMAQEGKSGDINLLMRARRSMSPSEWEGMTSGIIDNIGRDREGNFSPDRFITAYKKMSDNGKSALFGPAGNPVRDSLEDISKISGKFTELSEMANKSKTAPNVIGALSIFTPHLWKGMALAVPMSYILSNPRSAKLAAAIENIHYKVTSGNIAPKPGENMIRGYMQQIAKMYGQDQGEEREGRASGGRIKDYPAKRLSGLERAAQRAFKDIANETKPIMEMPDEHVAGHLGNLTGE